MGLSARVDEGREDRLLHDQRADCFFDWQRLDPKSKRPVAIALKGGKPFASAGLVESWHSRDGVSLETITILTNDPSEIMEPIHNRMPVTLEPKDYDRWLDVGDPARLPVDLLRPYPAEQMCAWPGERPGGQCAKQ